MMSPKRRLEVGAMETTTYLAFGTKVRRRQIPGEAGNRETGKAIGGTLDGRKTFVVWNRRGKRTMELLPTDELETVSATS